MKDPLASRSKYGLSVAALMCFAASFLSAQTTAPTKLGFYDPLDLFGPESLITRVSELTGCTESERETLKKENEIDRLETDILYLGRRVKELDTRTDKKSRDELAVRDIELSQLKSNLAGALRWLDDVCEARIAELRRSIEDEVAEALKAYARKNGIDLLIDKNSYGMLSQGMVLFDDVRNITPDFIEEYNAKTKATPSPAAKPAVQSIGSITIRITRWEKLFDKETGIKELLDVEVDKIVERDAAVKLKEIEKERVAAIKELEAKVESHKRDLADLKAKRGRKTMSIREYDNRVLRLEAMIESVKKELEGPNHPSWVSMQVGNYKSSHVFKVEEMIIENALRGYAKKHGIDLVIILNASTKWLLADDDLDISAAFIADFNAQNVFP